MQFNFGYNYSRKDKMHYNVYYEYLYNALYIKASSRVLTLSISVEHGASNAKVMGSIPRECLN